MFHEIMKYNISKINTLIIKSFVGYFICWEDKILFLYPLIEGVLLQGSQYIIVYNIWI